MDEIVRALGRNYHRDSTPENASLYIRALERAWGKNSDPSILLEIWGSLILGLLDPNGVNTATWDAIFLLTKLLFGLDAAQSLANKIGGQDGGNYLESQTWFDNFLEKINFVCPHTCPEQKREHQGCQAMVGSGKRCPCPGCHSLSTLAYPVDYFPGSPPGETSVLLCEHHHQIEMSQPRCDYSITVGSPSFRKNPTDLRSTDLAIRALEREYTVTADSVTAGKLLAAYSRAGLADQAMDFGRRHLWPQLKNFHETYMTFAPNLLRSRQMRPFFKMTLPPELEHAKTDLVNETLKLGYPASFFCLRPYHHIPYTNAHIEELALLHNARSVLATRNSDSFEGHATFDLAKDGHQFIEALTREFFFSDSIQLLEYADEYPRVEWHQYT